MEFGLRDLLTILTVVGGGYATVRVIETKLSRRISDVVDLRNTIKEIFHALDELQEGRGVVENQIATFKVILSPTALEKRARELAELQARLTVVERRSDDMARMHNGEHKPTGIKNSD